MVIKGTGFGTEYLRGVSPAAGTDPARGVSRAGSEGSPKVLRGKTDTIELSGRPGGDDPFLGGVRDEILRGLRADAGAGRIRALKSRAAAGEPLAGADELAEILAR